MDHPTGCDQPIRGRQRPHHATAAATAGRRGCLSLSPHSHSSCLSLGTAFTTAATIHGLPEPQPGPRSSSHHPWLRLCLEGYPEEGELRSARSQAQGCKHSSGGGSLSHLHGSAKDQRAWLLAEWLIAEAGADVKERKPSCIVGCAEASPDERSETQDAREATEALERNLTQALVELPALGSTFADSQLVTSWRTTSGPPDLQNQPHLKAEHFSHCIVFSDIGEASSAFAPWLCCGTDRPLGQRAGVLEIWRWRGVGGRAARLPGEESGGKGKTPAWAPAEEDHAPPRPRGPGTSELLTSGQTAYTAHNHKMVAPSPLSPIVVAGAERPGLPLGGPSIAACLPPESPQPPSHPGPPEAQVPERLGGDTCVVTMAMMQAFRTTQPLRASGQHGKAERWLRAGAKKSVKTMSSDPENHNSAFSFYELNYFRFLRVWRETWRVSVMQHWQQAAVKALPQWALMRAGLQRDGEAGEKAVPGQEDYFQESNDHFPSPTSLDNSIEKDYYRLLIVLLLMEKKEKKEEKREKKGREEKRREEKKKRKEEKRRGREEKRERKRREGRERREEKREKRREEKRREREREEKRREEKRRRERREEEEKREKRKKRERERKRREEKRREEKRREEKRREEKKEKERREEEKRREEKRREEKRREEKRREEKRREEKRRRKKRKDSLFSAAANLQLQLASESPIEVTEVQIARHLKDLIVMKTISAAAKAGEAPTTAAVLASREPSFWLSSAPASQRDMVEKRKEGFEAREEIQLLFLAVKIREARCQGLKQPLESGVLKLRPAGHMAVGRSLRSPVKPRWVGVMATGPLSSPAGLGMQPQVPTPSAKAQTLRGRMTICILALYYIGLETQCKKIHARMGLSSLAAGIAFAPARATFLPLLQPGAAFLPSHTAQRPRAAGAVRNACITTMRLRSSARAAVAEAPRLPRVHRGSLLHLRGAATPSTPTEHTTERRSHLLPQREAYSTAPPAMAPQPLSASSPAPTTTFPHTDSASPTHTRGWCGSTGASTSSGCKWGRSHQRLQAVAAAPIAPQEQGEVKKPLGVTGASSCHSHLLPVLSDQGQHWAPAVVWEPSGAGGDLVIRGWRHPITPLLLPLPAAQASASPGYLSLRRPWTAGELRELGDSRDSTAFTLARAAFLPSYAAQRPGNTGVVQNAYIITMAIMQASNPIPSCSSVTCLRKKPRDAEGSKAAEKQASWGEEKGGAEAGLGEKEGERGGLAEKAGPGDKGGAEAGPGEKEGERGGLAEKAGRGTREKRRRGGRPGTAGAMQNAFIINVAMTQASSPSPSAPSLGPCLLAAQLLLLPALPCADGAGPIRTH
ncbi:hypothetical protein QTO34_008470 [Cnephaeus nilssonii]|uniref:Uncharacterized protein n=1 Tax=Cnephaeus nilssonii TaxID=3371016 RepID=A0AA40IBG7_CNENI|nr:hypothetical protein QTO34_008470 [Eptesicus nilssonii]